MSFGTSQYSQALEIAIQDAYNDGILIIAAAGNGNVIEYPAAFSSVLSVGSIGPDAQPSDFGVAEEAEILASGECIAGKNIFDEVIVNSGTSLAAPHVAGAAAKLYVNNTDATNDIVRETLLLSANPIDKDSDESVGLLDSQNAEIVYDQIEQYDGDTPEDVEEEILNSNQEDIESYEDDPVVMSSWTEHGELTQDAIGENVYVYPAIIAGAQYPDNLCTLSEKPELHGGGFQNDTYNATNYVACYCLMITCANVLFDYEDNNGVTMTKQQLKNAVTDYQYSNKLKTYTNKYTNNSSYIVVINNVYNTWTDNRESHNKLYCKRFIYGMAMHVISDSFAHSAYKNIDNNWRHLNHNSNSNAYGADLTTVAANRYKIAKAAIKKTWNRLENENTNQDMYMDYYRPGKIEFYSHSGNDGFLMDRIVNNIIDCGGSLSDEVWGVLANIDREIFRLIYGW